MCFCKVKLSCSSTTQQQMSPSYTHICTPPYHTHKHKHTHTHKHTHATKRWLISNLNNRHYFLTFCFAFSIPVYIAIQGDSPPGLQPLQEGPKDVREVDLFLQIHFPR